MAKHTRSTFLRRKLGANLRRIREAAGYTLDEAALKLDKTRSALHRMETGETRIDVHLVRTMMDVYHHYDEQLLDDAREAYKHPWYRAYGLERMGYVDAETEASRVSEFSVTVLPGLLQTEPYTRTLLNYWRNPAADEEVEIRRIRQFRLVAKEKPLELTAVIDETVLQRSIGGHEVMREQLQRLVDVASLPTVTLQVLPAELGGPAATAGTFTLLTFPSPEDRELLYIEHVAGAAHIEDDEELLTARLVFDRLRTEALSPPDSVALIERMAGELNGH